MSELILDFQDKPDPLPSTSSLRHISLRGCCEWVTDEAFSELTTSGGIHTAELFRCWRLTDRGLSLFVKRNGSALRKLELSGCTHITDATLRAIGRFSTDLAELDLTRCLEISDVGINHIVGLSHLEVLLLYADAQLSRSAYQAIGQLPVLRKLDLCGHENLDTESLMDILKGCGGSLEYLNLSWCVSLTDPVLDGIVAHARLKRIKYLSIFGIKNFTAEPMRRFIAYLQTLPDLIELDIRAIPSIAELSNDDCIQLRTMLPNLVEWKLHH